MDIRLGALEMVLWVKGGRRLNKSNPAKKVYK